MAAQRTNNFNIGQNRYARRSHSDPYPKFEDVYRHSDTFNHANGFTDLYVQDFVYTHARIARRRLQTLELTEAERQLYHRGVRECDEEGVPECDEEGVPESVRTCMAYAGAIGVNAAEEAACLNNRVGSDGRGYFDLADNRFLQVDSASEVVDRHTIKVEALTLGARGHLPSGYIVSSL